MKGLLIKDLLLLKQQRIVLLGLLVFYSMYAVTFAGAEFISSMVVIICLMLPLTTMAYDEKSKWDKYALSMPIKRDTIVLSKYLFAILTMGIGAILVLGICFLASVFKDGVPIKETLLVTLAANGLALLYLSFMFPALFKFGVEKARILLLGFVFLPTMLIIMLPEIGIPLPSLETMKNYFYALPVLLVVLLLVSYRISVGIYKKKEF